jgi:hypothetical protein
MVSPCPALNFGGITLPAGRQQQVDRPLTGSCVLSDGTYTAQGALFTSASIDASGFSPPGVATADFFSDPVGAGPRGLFVSVDARPIPEPSTLSLLGLGAIFIAAGKVRRRL